MKLVNLGLLALRRLSGLKSLLVALVVLVALVWLTLVLGGSVPTLLGSVETPREFVADVDFVPDIGSMTNRQFVASVDSGAGVVRSNRFVAQVDFVACDVVHVHRGAFSVPTFEHVNVDVAHVVA